MIVSALALAQEASFLLGALAVVVVLGQKTHIFVFLVFDRGVHGLLNLLGVGFCGLLGGFLRLGGLRLLVLSCLLGLGLSDLASAACLALRCLSATSNNSAGP